jgi:tetratricopeptide (TPR) repeat protein
MIDSGRFNQARRTLRELNNQEPDAEAYYLLARLAEKEEDWGNVELDIQKSILLDPKNSRYHELFSSVLSRMNKLERAKKEAGLALKHSEKPDPLLFDHRALIRWKQGDYLGAARDWKRAIRLNPDKPDKASFHARAAEAYIKTGHLPSALKHYKMALELEPENAGYQQKYEEIKNAS